VTGDVEEAVLEVYLLEISMRKIAVVLISSVVLISCTLLLGVMTGDGWWSAPTQSNSGSVSPTPSNSGSVSPTPSNSGSVKGVNDHGWRASVYYTVVESYHPRTHLKKVTGCLNLECTRRGTIGTYPTRFVRKVKQEGTGRITSDEHAGKYLNWTYDPNGSYYWLDTAPRDSYGNALVPFETSASDTLPRGTRFVVVNCGHQEDGSKPAARVCDDFKRTRWEVQDEFTPGLGGDKHVDLYIGEEDMRNFENRSPKWVDLSDVVIRRL
jgi:hypothetical protein